MKKILFIVMACVLALGLMGGAFAYFSDTESSTGNTFTAGTIDLALNGENPYPGTAFITLSDIKPSHAIDPITITLENVGQNEGILTITWTIDGEKDKTEDTSADFEFAANVGQADENVEPATTPAMEMTANEFASLIYIQAITEDGVDILPALSTLGYDTNGDGKISLYELTSGPFTWSPATPPWDTYFAPGRSTVLVVTLHLGDSLDTPGSAGSDILTGVSDNRPQADGIEMSITAALTQVP
jgi:spore coat-associated protein N